MSRLFSVSLLVPVNSSKAKGQRVCQFFLKGHCKKGNDCNMKHDGAPQYAIASILFAELNLESDFE